MNDEDSGNQNDKIRVLTSVVRSKRNDQADQLQMSLINFDSNEFVTFRRSLHSGSYLIILKRKEKFEYEFYGVKPTSVDENLPTLNNHFYKDKTNTVVDIGALQLQTTEGVGNNIKGENLLIYGVPGCGKSYYIDVNYTLTADNSERIVFHPDYTYSDFVGQILPKVITLKNSNGDPVIIKDENGNGVSI